MSARLAALTVPALLLAACGGGTERNTVATTVVLSTANDCVTAIKELPAGSQTFQVRNDGSEVTELYVYDGDKVLGEVENVTPGTSRQLKVNLAPGTYQLACKPGGRNPGIRVPITVKAVSPSQSG